MAPPPTLEIEESQTDTGVRLALSGELDLASTARLEDRLTRFKVLKAPVRLNLSRLEFIDSTGIHLLIRIVGEARVKGWPLEIEKDIHPQVMRMFKLVHLDRFVSDGQRIADADGEPATAPVPEDAPAPAKPAGG